MGVRAHRERGRAARAAGTEQHVSMGHGGGGGNWGTLRSFSRDGKVAQQKLAPGTVRRIWTFASPYRRYIAFFLATVVVDALLTVAQPVIFGRIVNAITAGDGSKITRLAILLAVIAIVDTGVTLV